jgi:hypothetical protein
VAHFECPDMTNPLLFCVTHRCQGHRWIIFRRRTVSENASLFTAAPLGGWLVQTTLTDLQPPE